MRGGCRTATVLFTDLVGSTDLLSRLGEAAFDEVRRAHFAALGDVVGRYRGEEVKTLGDGVLAVFDAAADAVAGAVAIQRAVTRQSRSAPAPLAVRVGLALGDVSVEDDDVFGTPVVEAARLVAVAGPGEILATSVVAVVGGGRCESTFTEVGSVELKGLPKPVGVSRVEWEPLDEPRVPMPALLTDVSRIFVGRDAELERLMQLWKEAAAGERRVALLPGEPGVGKTRLAAELATRVHEEGGVVLAGRSDEDLGVPYQPFAEALRHFVDHAPAAELKERLGRYGGELVRLHPEVADRVPDLARPLQSDPETERYRLFDAVAAWLSAASTEDPLLLVLDDLQWAAKPTLLLLRHVVRAIDARRLLILGTYRDTELTHNHPLVELVADLRREATVERLPLSGLDDSAVVAMVEQAAGQALDQDGLALARAIYQETEGNPFFVREVLRHLTETNAIEREGGCWRTTLPMEQVGIPEGIRDVVGRRLSRLSGTANQALRVAAVVGAEFETDLLQAAGELLETELLAAMDEATDAGLVSEVSPTRFRFSHALVRATLYESLTGPRKVALHRHVAEAIEAVHEGDLDRYLPGLAHHWAKASAPAANSARAVEYARRAGDRALGQLAHDEAVGYYRHALELLTVGPPNEAGRLQLLLALGEAERRAGEAGYRETFFAAARLADELGDHEALARAALGNYRGWVSALGKVDPERLAVLERALELQPLGDSTTRARLMANLAVEVTYADDKRRDALSAEALAMARRVRDPATVARVLLARTNAISSPDTASERIACTRELVSLSERLDDPALACHGFVFRWLPAMDLGDAEEADHCLAEAVRLATETGQPNLRWLSLVLLANRELAKGHIERSERIALDALGLARTSGQPDGELYFGVHVFNVRFDQGRLGEIEDQVLRVVAANPALASVRALAAVLHCELGHLGEARKLVRLLVADLPILPRELTWLSGVARAAYVSAQLDDRESAEILLDLLLPYTGFLTSTGTSYFGSIAHHVGSLLAVLHGYDEAEDHFVAAEAMHSRLQTPAWLARTRLEWARMLLIRRDPGDARRGRELLGQALATARDLGLANVGRRAADLLQECR